MARRYQLTVREGMIEIHRCPFDNLETACWEGVVLAKNLQTNGFVICVWETRRFVLQSRQGKQIMITVSENEAHDE